MFSSSRGAKRRGNLHILSRMDCFVALKADRNHNSGLRLTSIPIQTIKFRSGEYLAKINEAISQSEEVIIIGSMVPPINDSLMRLVSIIDAVRNSGAKNITLISPYLGYSRQNSIELPYSSIGVKIIAQILESVGITRLITVDIHSLESLRYFSMEVIHINVIEILSYYSSLLNLNNVTIIAPDKGSEMRLKNLGYNIIAMNKTRNNNSIDMMLNGDVEGKNCLIIDDIIDSGKTIEAAIKCLKANKARDIRVYCTHFLGAKTPKVPLYVTDTVPLILNKEKSIEILPIWPVIMSSQNFS